MLRASGLVSGNAVFLVPLLSQAREEGPANQSGLTLEVEAKRFTKL